MSWFCVLCCVQGIVYVKAMCFVFCYKAWSCMIKSRIRGFLRLRFYTLFGHHEKSYENHGAAPGHLFNRESMHFFDFVFSTSFGHHQNSHEIMGQHLVIISRSTALRDTLTSEVDPGVSEYLRLYFIMSERWIDATSILLCELEASPV
jgi:hypothetical protein